MTRSEGQREERIEGRHRSQLVVSAHEPLILGSGPIEAMETIDDDHNFHVPMVTERPEVQHLLRRIMLAQRLLRATPASDADAKSNGPASTVVPPSPNGR